MAFVVFVLPLKFLATPLQVDPGFSNQLLGYVRKLLRICELNLINIEELFFLQATASFLSHYETSVMQRGLDFLQRETNLFEIYTKRNWFVANLTT